MRRVGLDFACNDPDNGNFAGRIEGIQLYNRSEPVFNLTCGDSRLYHAWRAERIDMRPVLMTVLIEATT